MKFSLC